MADSAHNPGCPRFRTTRTSADLWENTIDGAEAESYDGALHAVIKGPS